MEARRRQRQEGAQGHVVRGSNFLRWTSVRSKKTPGSTWKKTIRRRGNLNHLWYPTTRDLAKLWLQWFLDERFNLFGPMKMPSSRTKTGCGTACSPLPQHRLADPRVRGGRKHRLRREEQRPPELLLIRQPGWARIHVATYEDLGVKMRTTIGGTLAASPRPSTTVPRVLPHRHTIHRILDTGIATSNGSWCWAVSCSSANLIPTSTGGSWKCSLTVTTGSVPNVYAMSQNADGGLINQVLLFRVCRCQKNEQPPTGPWIQTWDGLYCRWIDDTERVWPKIHDGR